MSRQRSAGGPNVDCLDMTRMAALFMDAVQRGLLENRRRQEPQHT